MRTTITIYHDSYHSTHHTVVAEVSEGLPGESEVGTYQVVHSNVGQNRPSETLRQMWDNAARLVGVENVRVYMVVEWIPTSEMVGKILEREQRQAARRPDTTSCVDTSCLNQETV